MPPFLFRTKTSSLVPRLAASVLLSHTALVASQTFNTELTDLIRAPQAVAALGPTLFGDSVNLYNGTLTFRQTDVDLPGNNALSMNVTRSLTVGRTTKSGGLFSQWELEVPHLHGIFSVSAGWTTAANSAGATNARCSNFRAPPGVTGTGGSGWSAEDYWSGTSLYVPGFGEQDLLKRAAVAGPQDGQTYPITTARLWNLRCGVTLSNPGAATKEAGEGFLAVAPDGTQYRFDWLVNRPALGLQKATSSSITAKQIGRGATQINVPVELVPNVNGTSTLSRNDVWILPTLVTDRYGNTVRYTYDTTDTAKLLSMQASDGRTITFTYASGSHRIQSIGDGTRTWTYSYAAATPYGLTSVTLPDQSAWQLSGLDALLVNPSSTTPVTCTSTPASTSDTVSGQIVSPYGAVGAFSLTSTLHGRYGISNACNEPTVPTDSFNTERRYYNTRSLTAKTISGPGLSTLSWSYGYGSANTGAGCTSGCVQNAITTIVDARGFTTRTTFGNVYQVNEGRLLQTDEGWNGSSALRTTTYSYRAGNAGPYATSIGTPLLEMGDNVLNSVFTPLNQRSITQQGSTFAWAANSFDTLARPLSVTRSSSLGFSRTETTAYADNTTKWVLGQIGSVTEGSTGAVMASYGYDGTATLSSTTRFGHLEESLAYNGDGTLATRTDGNGRVTSYASYMRGSPQGITYADSSTQSAVVNNIGMLTSVTDEAGYTTGYGYDAMGRLASITPPSGDSVAWNPTTVAFEKVASAEYDIAAGHWRQTISTGNARTVSYYDALWRPILTKSYDTASPSATGSDVLRRYDADGRTVYAAYPTRGLTSVSASTPPGVASTYDALGRLTQTVASSELGNLTTTSAYLSGLQTQTTNARNYATTIAYQAWDDPSSVLTRSIAAPEGVSVSIARNVFGKAISVTRSGSYAGAGVSVTRSYVYDANQRLCKTVEPEVGATVQDYDGANNVAWKAPGQSLSSTSDCNRTSVAAAAQITYGYDKRNRLLTTGFGDNSPGITRSYTADGLLASVAANNATWSYGYNRRRLLASETLAYGGQSYGIGHGWDANGHAATLGYPDGTSIAYSPNALGQPTQAGDYASGVTWQPNGAVAAFNYGNGVAHSQTQTTRGLPLVNRDAGVLQDSYAYDAAGNVTAITDQQEGVTTRSLGYDGLDRLTVANDPNVWGNASYAYDALDNLRTSVVGSRSTTHGYDASNRLSSLTVNGTATGYAYDARGNITGKGAQGYYFDLGNRLQLVNGKANYTYDGLGRRTSIAAADGSTRIQVYDMAGELLYGTRMLGGVTSTTRYINLGGKHIAEATNNVREYDHDDALGSPAARTNTAAGITSRTRYEAYGNAAAGTNPTGIGYTGHVNDADTGLVYMQQRYYDPVAGRFQSVDPVVTDAQTGDLFNRYVYAQSNPYRYTDPDGRESVGEFIDRRAQEAAKSGNRPSTFGWAFAGAAWKAFGSEGVSQIADKGAGASTGDKVSAGVEFLAVVPGGKIVGEAAAAAKGVKAAELTWEQAKNVERFTAKLPSNAKDGVALKEIPNGGVAAQATSEGRVPGSSAVYEKQIDAAGKTIQYTKTTYDPAGIIVHVKDKISGGTYP